jgi:hypothetical protein
MIQRCLAKEATMSTAILCRSRVAEVLSQSSTPLLRRLKVEETDDEVILIGTLPTYFLKQMAQETIRPVLGERRLLNLIVVR